MTQKEKKENKIGRLKNLGVKYESQIPLMIPKSYKDYSSPRSTVHGFPLGETILVKMMKISAPQTKWENKMPKTSIRFQDASGYFVNATFFGDAREAVNTLNSANEFYISGKLGTFNQTYQISNPIIVPEHQVGRFIPKFNGKAKVINAEKVQERVLSSLDLIADSVDFVRSTMFIKDEFHEKKILSKLGEPDKSLFEVINGMHAPRYENEGYNCASIIQKLAALYVIRLGKSNADDRLNPDSVVNITNQDLTQASKGIPYPLTAEQKRAISGIVKELREPRAIQGLVSADVGAGKSSILGMIAKTASDNGAFVVLMAPNTVLCTQLLDDFKTWWPDIDASLVIGDTKGLPESKVLIGTTALLHRLKKSKRMPDILMVDEEHRFGAKQREELNAQHTNYIGSTATCVPRTMQLAMLGAFSVYRLTKMHVEKEIHTKVVGESEKLFLMSEVDRTLNEGRQALIIYPIAEEAEVDLNDLTVKKKNSAEGSMGLWEKRYPGRAVLVHGKMTDEEKIEAVNSLKRGDKDILVSTTVVEVGVHIPNLQTVVVVGAERYGLAQLHQIRGVQLVSGVKDTFTFIQAASFQKILLNAYLFLKIMQTDLMSQNKI